MCWHFCGKNSMAAAQRNGTQNLAGFLAQIGLHESCQNVSGAAATQVCRKGASKSGRQPRDLSCKICGVARHGLGSYQGQLCHTDAPAARNAGTRGGDSAVWPLAASWGCSGDSGSKVLRLRRFWQDSGAAAAGGLPARNHAQTAGGDGVKVGLRFC